MDGKETFILSLTSQLSFCHELVLVIFRHKTRRQGGQHSRLGGCFYSFSFQQQRRFATMGTIDIQINRLLVALVCLSRLLNQFTNCQLQKRVTLTHPLTQETLGRKIDSARTNLPTSFLLYFVVGSLAPFLRKRGQIGKLTLISSLFTYTSI